MASQRSRRIALVGHNLKVAGGLAVGKNILRVFPKVAPEIEFLAVVPGGVGFESVVDPARCRLLIADYLSYTGRWLWEEKVLRKELHRFAPDWIWALGNFGLVDPGYRQSVLVHSSHLLGYPWRNSGFPIGEIPAKWVRRRLQRHAFARGLRFCQNVYTQTEVARQRLHRAFGVPLERIALCPNAFGGHAAVGTGVATAKERQDGTFRLFTFTRYYPHKNLERIVEVFRRFRGELDGVTCRMAVAEDQGPAAARLMQAIRAHGLGDRIFCVGGIEETAIGSAYAEADALFLPSLLESFSGTYLEAMHFGVPIITSDLDFAREICGEAAVYCDPFDVCSLKDAVLSLKGDEELARRIVQAGHVQVMRYTRTWEAILNGVLRNEGMAGGD